MRQERQLADRVESQTPMARRLPVSNHAPTGNMQSGRDVMFIHENARLLGDLNGDGRIDNDDLDILLYQWGSCPCCAGDLNGDGSVGVPDQLILMGNWTGD